MQIAGGWVDEKHEFDEEGYLKGTFGYYGDGSPDPDRWPEIELGIKKAQEREAEEISFWKNPGL